MEPTVPVEQHEPEVPVTSGPDLPAAAVEAGTAAVEGAEAECEPAEEPEQCCSG